MLEIVNNRQDVKVGYQQIYCCDSPAVILLSVWSIATVMVGKA